jgi:hypothetical protein
MRKVFDDLTCEEIADEKDICKISIVRLLDDKPLIKPLEVSAITADKIRKSLVEVANKGF